MIDTREEVLYPLSQVRKFLPASVRTGKPVCPAVIWRWVKNGLRAGDGTVVKLEALKCGGSLCTSREAIDRFFAELTARSGLSVRPPVASARDRERIGRELVAAGLK